MLDLYAPAGTRVVFAYPDFGYEPDQRLAWEYLRQGAVYTIEEMIVEAEISWVYLMEVPQTPFNSVHFDYAPLEISWFGESK